MRCFLHVPGVRPRALSMDVFFTVRKFIFSTRIVNLYWSNVKCKGKLAMHFKMAKTALYDCVLASNVMYFIALFNKLLIPIPYAYFV